jgi:hypothetical protein
MMKRIFAASLLLAAAPVLAGDASYEHLSAPAQASQQRERPPVSKDAQPHPAACACRKA